MPSLRSIKDRISSINSTQKITRAMKMVAAVKVKKAELSVREARPFAAELYKLFSQALEAVAASDKGSGKYLNPIDNYPVLLEEREVKTAGLLVIASNKGLAGSYIANVIKFAQKRIKELIDNGIEVKVFLVGNRGAAPLKSLQKTLNFEIVNTYTRVMDNLSIPSSMVVTEDIAEAMVNHTIDSIELITTRYQNMVSYRVEDWALLPAKLENSIVHSDDPDSKIHHDIDSLMEFEPSADAVLQKVVPMYITNIIYQALLEANASELASRMTAMSAATNNAQDMIRTLTIDYNKARQAAITQELIEIIGGADALK